MDALLIAGLGIGGMFLLILLHVPIGVAMGVAGVVGFALLTGPEPALAVLKIELAGLLTSRELAVIPLFLFMGGLAGGAGLSDDLYRLFTAFIGHRRGGLSLATIGSCAGFGAVSGSSLATAVTMGRIALPQMMSRGYKASIATGTVAAGGTLGMLIPPSLVMIIYAVLTEQFVITMFVAAIVPGLLAVALHIVAIIIYTRLDPAVAPVGPAFVWRERLIAVAQSWRILTIATVMTVGLYGGFLTVEEAAATGAAMTFLFALVGGRLNLTKLKAIVFQAASSTATIYLIILGASVFTYFISVSQVTRYMVDFITSLGLSNTTVILALLLMYLILGSVFETISSIVITLPFVFPLIVGMGYDPIWWGVMMVMVIEIGLITPPIGMNVFVIHSVAPKVPLRTIYLGTLPFLTADIVRLGLVVAFPALALWLPGVLGF
ncbi:MAG: TRAP transporter large permease [Roseovarius sp.]